MDDYLRVQADRHDGMCLLRVVGELDSSTTHSFIANADAAVQAIPGPVTVDLSALKFVDISGARALTLLLRALSADRLADVTGCTRSVRRVLQLVGLQLPRFWLARRDATAPPGIRDLVGQIDRALQDATECRLTTSGTIASLQSTCVRVASTRERNALRREQAQKILADVKAAREQRTHSRQSVT